LATTGLVASRAALVDAEGGPEVVCLCGADVEAQLGGNSVAGDVGVPFVGVGVG
jgi:hypothetical protein